MPNKRYDIAKIEDSCQELNIYLKEIILENVRLVTQPCADKIVISGNYQFAVLQELTASFLDFPNLNDFINLIDFEQWDFFKVKDLAKTYEWQQYVIAFEHTVIVVLTDIPPKCLQG